MDKKKMVKKEKACGVLRDHLFWYDDSRLYVLCYRDALVDHNNPGIS
jgi:hypothetical protein